MNRQILRNMPIFTRVRESSFCSCYHSLETGTISGFLFHPLLPSTVTKPVTNQEMSKAVVSRDAEFVFGKFYDPLIADSMIHRPDSA